MAVSSTTSKRSTQKIVGKKVEWRQSQPSEMTFPIRDCDYPSSSDIVFTVHRQYAAHTWDSESHPPTRLTVEPYRLRIMDPLDLDADDHGSPPHLEGDEESDSYQSTEPPRYIEARAKLVFPDCDYPITKPVNIIGRGPGTPRVLASRNLNGFDAEESEDYITTGSKRRRISSPEYNFRGGVGGPQSPASPDDDDPVVERINIWPPLDENENVPNTISREHAKIIWDTYRQGWILEVLGRNGLYLQGDFYRRGDCACLAHEDNIVISQVEIYFYTAEAGLDEEEESDPEESDDSTSEDSGDDDSQTGAAIEIIPSRRRRPAATIELDEEEEDDDEEDEEMEDEEGEEEESRAKHKIRLNIKPPRRKVAGHIRRRSTTTVKYETPSQEANGRRKRMKKTNGTSSEAKSRRRTTKDSTPEEQTPDYQEEIRLAAEQDQRKRGPGRPPADGVMSKKERRDRERAKRLGLEYGKDELPVRPHTKPRKEKDVVDYAVEDTKKPKKGKRKANEVEDADGQPREDDDGSPFDQSVPRKEPTPRPATPEPRREEFSHEQLQKPELTYHVMLVDILSKSDRSMSLPEIYKAFKKRWPYFHFLASHGWESSIRHNLQSSPCILKDGKQGKGHNWKFHPELMKEEPKQRPKPSQSRAPAYQPMTASAPQQSLPQGHAYQPHIPSSHQPTPHHQQVSGQPIQGLHQAQPLPQGQPQHPYTQIPQSQPGPHYNSSRPVGQMLPAANSTSQPQTHATVSNRVAPPGQSYTTPAPARSPAGAPTQQASAPYPAQGVSYAMNGASQYQPSGQSRAPGVLMAGVSLARAAVPAPVGNTLAGTKSARDNKRQVFEHFRSSLVKNVRDVETQLRYNRLVNQAIDWLMRNPDASTFHSADGDLNKVVPQMMSLWNTHHMNPASSNFSGYGSPTMRQSPSTSAGPSQSPSTRGPGLTGGATISRPPSVTQTGQTHAASTPTVSASGTPQPPPNGQIAQSTIADLSAPAAS